MVLGRRPARFKKPDFMQTESISHEKLDVLRAAAARVYINEENPEENSSVSVSEVKAVAAGYANLQDESDNDNGMHLLAAVATRLKMEEKLPLDLRWRWKKRRTFVSGRKHPEKSQ